MTSSTEEVKVRDLQLDSMNPRLPEALSGGKQEDILNYLFRNGNLEELAQSLLDNGYFPAEPLVADRNDVVLEGNRRLAALKILLQEGTSLTFSHIRLPTTEEISRLSIVPVVRVDKREDADRFIAFRHIGGLKEWEPEAKARYVYRAVRELAEQGDGNPFQTLAARVGSNSQAMRSAYLAMALLKSAYVERGIDIRSIQNERFGVWTRAMSSREIRDFMGATEARTVVEIDNMLHRVDYERVARVIRDMTSQDGARPAISDSRHLSTYGKILANERASTVFARFGYDVASRIVELNSISERIQRLVVACKELAETITESEDPPDEGAIVEANHLLRYAKMLVNAINDR